MTMMKKVGNYGIVMLGVGLFCWLMGLRSVKASGAMRTLSLERGVRRASYVLVVSPDDPPTEQHKVYIPYRKRGKSKVIERKVRFLRLKVLRVMYATTPTTVTAASFLKSGKMVSQKPYKMAKKGNVLRVMSSHTAINNRVSTVYLSTGIRKIPIYYKLDEKIAHKGNPKGKMMLLADYEPSYEAFSGVADKGLISMNHFQQVKNLINKLHKKPNPKGTISTTRK